MGESLRAVAVQRSLSAFADFTGSYEAAGGGGGLEGAVAVVSTAITRPPVECVRFTNRAVVSGTSNSSVTGGSPAPSEETPACSVIGAIVMPDVIREVTSSVLKGRAALAISVAERPLPPDVRVADRRSLSTEVLATRSA